MQKLIFVVEDSPVQQKMLQVHFEEMLGNYKVKIFSEPELLVSELHQKPFAIILDHFLGETAMRTGLDYLKIIRKKSSSVPVIYYTTLNDEKVKAEVTSMGNTQYIIKDSASLVRLRTTLDELEANSRKGKSFFKKLFG